MDLPQSHEVTKFHKGLYFKHLDFVNLSVPLISGIAFSDKKLLLAANLV